MRLLPLAAMIISVGCSAASNDFALTPEGVKSLSPKIIEVTITPQVDPSKAFVSMVIEKNPVFGGASDWNSVAIDFDGLAKRLFSKPAVIRVRAEFIALEPKRIGWAYVDARVKNFPSNWNELTYLQRFGRLDVDPGQLQTGRWLCDFYRKYSSARPVNWPHGCD